MTCVSCGSDRVVSFGRNTEGWLSGCLRCGITWVASDQEMQRA